jgi:D-alanine transaminase
MTEKIWINGDMIPMSAARIDVEDRGFQFADGVYEVVRIYNKKSFALAEHLQRFWSSAQGIALALPMAPNKLESAIRGLIWRYAPDEGYLYLQATRGVAPRAHAYPVENRPTVLFYTRELPEGTGKLASVSLHSVADERWKRCWIKSIALLPNVLAKNQALAAGADEAVFVDDGVVTECSSSNLLVVSGGVLVTHPVGPKVLPGITRKLLLELAAGLGIKVEERPLPVSEALAAEEILITSTTREVAWVSQWDGKPVGSGQCGEVARKLHKALRKKVAKECARAA